MANEPALSAELQETLHGFYRHRDAGKAALALAQLLDGDDLDYPPILYTFGRIAELSPEARAGFMQLRDRHRQYIDRILDAPRAADFPRPRASDLGALDLDLLWAEFFVSGEAVPVLRIISVLDGEDLVRERLAHWLRMQISGFWGRRRIEKLKPMFVRCVFPIDYEHGSIEEGVDLDVHVAVNARSGNLKFSELPFELSQAECVRLAVKSAALWSLRANAAVHERVAEICAVEATRQGGCARQLLAPSPA